MRRRTRSSLSCRRSPTATPRLTRTSARIRVSARPAGWRRRKATRPSSRRRRFRRARATSAPSHRYPIRRFRNRITPNGDTDEESNEETDSDAGDDHHHGGPGSSDRGRRPGASSGETSQARPHRGGATRRVVDRPIDDHQVDEQQSWRRGRPLRHRAVRYRSQGPEQDGEVSHEVEPSPREYDISGAAGPPRATNDLLLPRSLRGERWQEASAADSRQQVHYAGARGADTGFSSARSRCAADSSAVGKWY